MPLAALATPPTRIHSSGASPESSALLQFKAQHPTRVSQLLFFLLDEHFVNISQQKFQNSELKNQNVTETESLGGRTWILFLKANYCQNNLSTSVSLSPHRYSL